MINNFFVVDTFLSFYNFMQKKKKVILGIQNGTTIKQTQKKACLMILAARRSLHSIEIQIGICYT